MLLFDFHQRNDEELSLFCWCTFLYQLYFRLLAQGGIFYCHMPQPNICNHTHTYIHVRTFLNGVERAPVLLILTKFCIVCLPFQFMRATFAFCLHSLCCKVRAINSNDEWHHCEWEGAIRVCWKRNRRNVESVFARWVVFVIYVFSFIYICADILSRFISYHQTTAINRLFVCWVYKNMAKIAHLWLTIADGLKK